MGGPLISWPGPVPNRLGTVSGSRHFIHISLACSTDNCSVAIANSTKRLINAAITAYKKDTTRGRTKPKKQKEKKNQQGKAPNRYLTYKQVFLRYQVLKLFVLRRVVLRDRRPMALNEISKSTMRYDLQRLIKTLH